MRCPVYLNLREHIAQTEPDEALYRHAQKIGLEKPNSLIAAWRAGYVSLFLDGFDELTPPQFTSPISHLRQARRFAVEIVSRFNEQTPMSAPIMIAGRQNYFDDLAEAQAALGYVGSAQEFDLGGFEDKDIARFLKTKSAAIPSWLPTRPLLLGYLANADVLKSGAEPLAINPASGWDQILQRVCDREVRQIWGAGYDGREVRVFVERLATRARRVQDKRGLDEKAIQEVFRIAFNRDTDIPAQLLAGRLPGLNSLPGRPGVREFVDFDFADAAASGDLKRYIQRPYDQSSPLENVGVALGDLGRAMSIHDVANADARVSHALSLSSQAADLSITSFDLLSILIDLQKSFNGDSVTMKDTEFESIKCDADLDFSKIVFSGCVIKNVELGRSPTGGGDLKPPRFHNCAIGRIDGAVSAQDLPAEFLSGTTTVESYSAFAATNDAVVESALPAPVKVLLTVLRKLFMQRGTGRQYSALRRGLPAGLIKYVNPIIDAVKAEKFASDLNVDNRTILIPCRGAAAEALAIINGPNASQHPLIVAVRLL